MTSYDILSDVKHPTHKMFIIHEFVWEVTPHNPMGLILSLKPNEHLQTELTLRQTQYLGELPRKFEAVVMSLCLGSSGQRIPWIQDRIQSSKLEGVRKTGCIWYSLWFRHCSQPMCPSHLGLSTTIDPPIVTRSPGFNRFGFGGPTPSVWYLWLGGREVLPIRTLTNASKHLPHD